MRSIQKIVLHVLMLLTVAGVVYAQNGNTDAEFWFLKEGVEPTLENRINAIKNVGAGILDFVIYQPTDATGKPLDTFPDVYRQKLIDAGFVFDVLTEEQLSKTTAEWSVYHNSPVGRVLILVIPEAVSLSVKEIERLKHLRFAFLGEATELPGPIPLTPEERERYSGPGYGYATPEFLDGIQKTLIKKSLTDLKNEIEAERKRMQDRLATFPFYADKSDEEIDAVLQGMLVMTPRVSEPDVSVMDQIGGNLAEAVGLFTGRAKAVPENFIAETGIKLLARRALLPYETKNVDAVDVFYIFANTQKNAKPVDGWFRLNELSSGRSLGHVTYTDRRGGFIVAKSDRAFLMDPITGKIGEAEVRNHRTPSENKMEIRIQMKPGETLIVRVVRERSRSGNGPPAGAGFQEFESLPAWDYKSMNDDDETVPVEQHI